ncbi:selenoprotein O2 [Cololabis saira]|uniref:selenoprotein O2 n=1 Tax=Cololabis saira TaxID=129043 RepID=UPI002AD30C66|nr:selenoprotein O2 [Cololabis saira]
MESSSSSSGLERLPFNNTVLKKLPVDESERGGSRTVRGACFSRLGSLQPLLRPRLVSVSAAALRLLGVSAPEVLLDPAGPELLGGCRLLPGSQPAAHCYSGHQFGLFAGQLGDGAAMYLGEVEHTQGRWEMQLKGAGVTPYSRDGDGRKVLRSSIREFLCSEAMAALGIPSTRAASLVTSDLYVNRDPLNSGHRTLERCSVVLRLAPSFIRFGSFEIFLGRDGSSGLEGPSAGRHDIRAQLLDYVVETFYPHIQQAHGSRRKSRNGVFFREVMMRTAKLVAQWQCVGFCHGVLNTDNMSILGLTLDYGPFGFMDRFDPDFVCNASDKRRRYSYQAQPSVCRWNLARLAEALGSELDAGAAAAVLEDFTPTYEDFYLGIMRKKLGLVQKEEAADGELVSDLLRVMHITGADFTNTFQLLSCVGWPEEGDGERAAAGPVVALILQQCASIEELKNIGKQAYQDNIELAMILSMAESDPVMCGVAAEQPALARQLELIRRMKEIVETDEDPLKEKLRDDWLRWVCKYRRRLGRESDGTGDLSLLKRERLRVMNSNNPRVVLRNYIAQNAIRAAESGDFSEVNRVLKALENPYADPETFCGLDTCGEQKPKESEVTVDYSAKPPAWARTICIT